MAVGTRRGIEVLFATHATAAGNGAGSEAWPEGRWPSTEVAGGADVVAAAERVAAAVVEVAVVEVAVVGAAEVVEDSWVVVPEEVDAEALLDDEARGRECPAASVALGAELPAQLASTRAPEAMTAKSRAEGGRYLSGWSVRCLRCLRCLGCLGWLPRGSCGCDCCDWLRRPPASPAPSSRAPAVRSTRRGPVALSSLPRYLIILDTSRWYGAGGVGSRAPLPLEEVSAAPSVLSG